MGYTPYTVANMKTGLEKDVDSFLIAEDAFVDLENAYLWRGRVYVKGGSQTLGSGLYGGRLGVRTDFLIVRAGAPQVYNAATLSFPIEPGTLRITDGTTIFLDDGAGNMVVAAGAGTAGTIVYATGVYMVTFNALNNGAAVTADYIVAVNANSPVMGLRSFELANTGDEGLVAFDMTTSYFFVNANRAFSAIPFYKGTNNPVNWTGTNTDFFYTSNYQNAMFTTNNTPGAQFYTITAITNAAAAQVTTSVANNFAVGDLVYFNNVQGMTQINNQTGTVTIVGNPFTVNINSAAYGAYTGGGVAWSQNHTKAASGDGIRWFDGFSPGLLPANGWVNFAPPLDAPTVPAPRILQGCLIIVPYKDHLVCLNTVEGTTFANKQRFANRARYSQNGNVYYAPPLPQGITAVPTGQEWLEIPGRGGFVDAPVNEEIVAAEFVKDTLVVYFEESTWQLLFTGNTILPFTWNKINTEIGAESTFSVIPFDRAILSVGQNGIYTCDSVNIDRIDRIIPDQIFEFKNSNGGVKRVYGIRDFYSEMAYWSYTNASSDSVNANVTIFPNRSLIYNYITGSYSIFKNSFTCYGYYHTFADLIWQDAVHPFDAYVRAWGAAFEQSGFPIIVSGNQQGFVFQLENADGDDFYDNPQSLVIQNITNANPSVFTSPNHNLEEGDFIRIAGTIGTVGINLINFEVATVPTANTFTLIDVNQVPVTTPTYTSGGKILIIDNFSIVTKNLNPFFQQGRSMRMGYMDFYFSRSEVQLQAIVLHDDDEVNEIDLFDVNLSAGVGADQQKFWKRVYVNTEGQFIAIKLTFDDEQMFEQQVQRPIILHGVMMWMKQAGRLVQ